MYMTPTGTTRKWSVNVVQKSGIYHIFQDVLTFPVATEGILKLTKATSERYTKAVKKDVGKKKKRKGRKKK